MAATTIYDVKVRYMLSDRASRGLDRIANSAARAAAALSRIKTGMRSATAAAKGLEKQAIITERASRKLNKASGQTQGRGVGRGGGGLGLGRVLGIAGGFFGAREAIKHTIGFNREVEQTQQRLTGVIQLNQKLGRENALGRATVLMNQLRQDAKASAGTFQEMVDFSAAIAGPLLKAGGTVDDLREITRGGVVASSVLGESAEFAQLDIGGALRGELKARDRFARQIIEPMGITIEAFNKLTAPERVKTLKEAFNQKAIQDAAKAYETSFEGVFSTFTSNLQEFGGKVGSRLFAALSKELARINLWFDQNEKRVDEIAKNLARGLMDAFEMAKKIFSFLIENREMILMVAKAFLVGKAAGAITSPIVSLAQASGTAATGLGKLAGALPAIAAGAQLIADSVLASQEATLTSDVKRGSLSRSAAMFQFQETATQKGKGLKASRAAGLFTAARQEKLIDDKGKLTSRALSQLKLGSADPRQHAALDTVFKMQDQMTRQQFATWLDGMQGLDVVTKDILVNTLRSLDYEKEWLEASEARRDSVAKAEASAKVLFDGMSKIMEFSLSRMGFEMPKIGGASTASVLDDKRSTVKVDKMVVNVESNDPDRFALGLQGIFSDLAKNGAQAVSSVREGFK